MNHRIKKWICVSLAGMLALSLCACGKKSIPYSKGVKEGDRLAWYLGGNNLLKAEVDPKELLKDADDTIDPAAIYANLDWNEEMLHGVYTLNHEIKGLKSVKKNIPFEEMGFKEGVTSVIPVGVYFGADNIPNAKTGLQFAQFKDITGQEVAILEFATKQAVVHTPCIYTLDGNSIIFRQIRQTSAVYEPFAYEFTGTEFIYDFSLTGPYFTLSLGADSLQLKAYCVTQNAKDQLYLRGFSQPNSVLVDSLDSFSSSSVLTYAVKRDGSQYDRSAFKFDDTGRFTVYLEQEDPVSGETQVFTQQYAYILQSSSSSLMDGFSVILMDESKIYNYSDSDIQREVRALEEQGVDVAALTENEIEAIAEKKADLFDDLYAAFLEEGIDATINRSTGEIALESTILFEVGESTISGNGKVLLREFMEVYTGVVFSNKYEDFVSKILVEGHTDTSGSYELNQQLSLDRANSVMAYCLSDECGANSALEAMMEAAGYAYDKPVYDENGEVNMEASRRVAFRFFVNVKAK